MSERLPRDDYRELINLAALMAGFDINITLRKHVCNALSTLKCKCKLNCYCKFNDALINLTAHELIDVQRFNIIVVCMYMYP